MRRRHTFRVLPPRLARAASLALGPSSLPPIDVGSEHDLLMDSHRRLLTEVLALRSQARGMMAHRDLLIQQARASTRWELMKEWLEGKAERWVPEVEYQRYIFLFEGAG